MNSSRSNAYHRIARLTTGAVILATLALAGCRRSDPGASTFARLAQGVPLKPVQLLGELTPFFVPGETLTWTVTFKGFEGGRARLAVGTPGHEQGHDVVIVQAQAESSGLFAVVKQVRDDASSWVDVKTGIPLRSESTSNLDGKQVVVHTQFQSRLTRAKQIVWRAVGKGANAPVRRRDKITRLPTEHTHDPMSSLLLIRAWDTSDGARGAFWTLGGTRLWRTELTVEGRETISSPLGARPCVRINGISRRMLDARREETTKKPRTFTVWLTDDAQRLPLRIAAHTEYGDILVDLTSYEAPAAKGR